jgi:hypothetical protein
MLLKTGVLAMLIACTAMPLSAATRAQVTIGTPVILVDGLDPDPAAPPARFDPGGPRIEEFHHYLSPAPVGPELTGNAVISGDSETSVGGSTHGPDSYFIVVGDRYAESFTFTATAHTRVTVEAPYTLASAIEGEPFYPDHPARTLASFELVVVAFNDLSVDSAGNLQYNLLAVETDFAELTSPLDSSLNGERSKEGTLRVSFDNLSDQPAVFAFRGEMVAWGVSAPSTPAPEPAGVLLMLAGLGVVAVVVRRRRPG